MAENKNEQTKFDLIEIPDKMFFKIRDVAKIVDVKPHVLRYWESEFQSLSPQKNKNGQRMYTRKDVEMAIEIRRLLHMEKYSIAGAKRKLKKRKSQSQKENSHAYNAMKSVRNDLLNLVGTLKKNP